MDQGPEAERRQHEASVAGQHEKLDRDLRSLLGKQAWMLDAWSAARAIASVTGYVVRHPVTVARLLWQRYGRRG